MSEQEYQRETVARDLAVAQQRAIAALARLSEAKSRKEYDQLQLQRIQADTTYYAALARFYALQQEA